MKYLYWKTKVRMDWDAADIMSKANMNAFKSVGSRLTPNEIFIKYYKKY